MPWRVNYDQRQEIAEVTYWGDTDANDIRESTIAAIGLVNETQATRGLVDCLKQTSTASTADLYVLPQLYEEEGLTRKINIAFVEPEIDELRELAEFYDNVCVNRGWNLRRFAAREEAIAWLIAP